MARSRLYRSQFLQLKTNANNSQSTVLPFQRFYLLATHNASKLEEALSERYESVMRSTVISVTAAQRLDVQRAMFSQMFLQKFSNVLKGKNKRSGMYVHRVSLFSSPANRWIWQNTVPMDHSCILSIPLAPGICDKWLQNVLLSFFPTTRARRPALQHDCIETDGKDTTKKEEWQNEQPLEDARSKFSVVQHQKRLAPQKFLRICT